MKDQKLRWAAARPVSWKELCRFAAEAQNTAAYPPRPAMPLNTVQGGNRPAQDIPLKGGRGDWPYTTIVLNGGRVNWPDPAISLNAVRGNRLGHSIEWRAGQTRRPAIPFN